MNSIGRIGLMLATLATCITVVLGQQSAMVNHMGNGLYEYEGTLSEFHKMRDVFAKDEMSLNFFDQFDRKRKLSNRMLIGGSSLMVGGAAAAIVTFYVGTDFNYVLIPSFVIGSAIGLVGSLYGIVLKKGSESQKRRALHRYNEYFVGSKSDDNYSLDLKLGMNGGVGVVLQF